MQSHSSPTPIRAKVVRVGNSVGVRLPSSLGLKTGEEVEVIIRRAGIWPEGYFESWEPIAYELPEREGVEVFDARLTRLFGKKDGL